MSEIAPGYVPVPVAEVAARTQALTHNILKFFQAAADKLPAHKAAHREPIHAAIADVRGAMGLSPTSSAATSLAAGGEKKHENTAAVTLEAAAKMFEAAHPETAAGAVVEAIAEMLRPGDKTSGCLTNLKTVLDAAGIRGDQVNGAIATLSDNKKTVDACESLTANNIHTVYAGQGDMHPAVGGPGKFMQRCAERVKARVPGDDFAFINRPLNPTVSEVADRRANDGQSAKTFTTQTERLGHNALTANGVRGTAAAVAQTIRTTAGTAQLALSNLHSRVAGKMTKVALADAFQQTAGKLQSNLAAINTSAPVTLLRDAARNLAANAASLSFAAPQPAG